jgi:DNA-binding beta-propeller fold protein YncE
MPKVIVLFAVVLVVSTGVAAATLHAGPAGAARSSVPQASGHRGNVANGAAGPVGSAQVLSTLVLFNNTVLPGDFPNVVSAINPEALAWDTRTDRIWVTAYGSDAVGVIDPVNETGVRWIKMPHEPWGVAYDNRTDRIFVADTVESKLTVLNASSYQIVGSVPVPAYPRDLLYVWQTDELWSANYWHKNVTVLNPNSGAVIAQIPTGTNPDALQYVPALSEMFVANFGSKNITIIDVATYAVVGSIPIVDCAYDDCPLALLYVPTTKEMYVSSDQGVVVVNPANRTQGPQIHEVYPAASFAFDPTTGIAYAITLGGGWVQMIQTSNDTLVGNISYGNAVISQGYLWASLYIPGLDRVFVSNINTEAEGIANLTVISTVTNTLVAAIPLQFFTDGVVYDSARGVLYVYDGGAGLLYEISTSTGHILRSVSIHTSDSTDVTNGMAFDPQNEWLYLDYGTYWQQGLVVVNVSTFNVVATVQNNSVGSQIGPGGILYDPTDDRVFASNFIGSNVTVYQASTHAYLGAIPTGRGPVRFSWDPVRDWVFVVNQGSENVTVFNGSTGAVVGNFATNHCPTGILYDPHSAQVYVQNTCSSKDITVNSVPGFTHVATVGIPGGGPTWGLSYDSVNDSILANCDNYSAGVVYVINGTTHQIVASTNVSYSPSDIVYAPAIDRSFVTGFWNGTVSTIRLGGALSSGPKIDSFQAEPSSFSVGNSTNLAVGASGGVGPLTYVYSTLPAGCSTENTSTLSCTPTGTGTYVVGVNVTDVQGHNAAAVTSFTVTPSGSGVVIHSFVAVPSTVTLGNTSNLTVDASGGVGPLTYVYSTLPTGCSTDNISKLPCAPTSTGRYIVGVNVTDVQGHTAAAVTSFTVTPSGSGVVIHSFVAVPSTVTLGNTSDLTVTTTGGQAPFSYSYSALPPGCATQDLATLPCTPNTVGSYTVKVDVYDASESHANATAQLTVVHAAKGAPVIASFEAVPDTIAVGQVSNLTVLVSGGTGTYTFVYTSLPPGCDSSNTSRLACTPTSSGTFHPNITVTDAAGKSANATAALTVTAASGSGASTGNSLFSNPWFWIGAVLVIALLLLLFVVVARRRRRKEPETSPAAPTHASPAESPGGSDGSPASAGPPGDQPPPG